MKRKSADILDPRGVDEIDQPRNLQRQRQTLSIVSDEEFRQLLGFECNDDDLTDDTVKRFIVVLQKINQI